MLISRLIQNINNQLEDELLNINELCNVIDKAIDDINTRLNTKFPVLSDLLSDKDNLVTEYTAIPDKYIRTVVIPGAVFKFYINDEEGAAVAPKHEEEYLKGLFYMERDYIPHVPEQYQDIPEQGFLQAPQYANGREGGFTVDTSVFQL